VLGGRNAVGRHLRYRLGSHDGQLPPEQQWIEIVGVVRDLGMHGEASSPTTAGAYMPLNLRGVVAVMITARVVGDMTASTNALRSIAAKADSTLRISDVQPLSSVTAYTLRTINYVARGLGMVSLAALVLALSGLYAVMSFTVSRRTREIGIRVALGSQRARVVLAILRRPLIQLATGVGFGALLTLAFGSMFDVTLGFSIGLLGYGLVMLAVCLLACVVPARRALKVDAIAALRAE
jgi:ABC-type antimicrobial peptide transport system permease subunit